ncbi:hypothetical protein [Amycolatopsis sp. cmx-4-68]|uniref:hypothetical protein n=1 Tax=Amycolatopsis sp. cmx-4-68 TaxID=2790938 RepID=UPI0039783B21
MMWLFGQIWLWLVVAFALGALTSWLVLRATQHPRPAPHEPEAEYEHEHEPEPVAPDPLSTEQTQFIPAAWAQHEPTRTDAFPGEDEPEPVGHREGRLPLPPQRGPQAEDWPTEDEPAWPEAEEHPNATPQWPHQPGRGG